MVFDEASLVLACKGRPSAILSSTADGRGRLVADNFIEVNGENVCAGGMSGGGVENCFNDPVFGVVGTPALDAYQSVPPIDVSRLMPHGARSTVTFSLVDFGGIYANSDLWLVTNCTASRRVDICHKPGTRAEHVITVSQSAVSGHLGHGDTIDSRRADHLDGRRANYPRRKNYSERSASDGLTPAARHPEMAHAIKATHPTLGSTLTSVSGSRNVPTNTGGTTPTIVQG